MGYYDKQDPEVYLARATDLQAHFQKKHTEIEKVRDIVRLRTQPQQIMDGKYLLTARNAMGWAIVAQVRSFFDRATRKIEVMNDTGSRRDDKRTTQTERWLIGSSDTVNRRSGFVESNALFYGIETGEQILGAAFDPYLAKQGKFPIEIMAPDPLTCAYARSNYGLTDFVTEETRTVAAVRDELLHYQKRGSAGGVFIPERVIEDQPSAEVTDMRYFTQKFECRFIDGVHVYTRRHLMGRVPFDIGYLYDLPSDRPEEFGLGVISPVRDLLESYQQLIDVYATDAELGQRPLAILFDGQKYKVVQINPGEDYPITNAQTASLTPVAYNPNHQLLHEVAGIIAEQIDIAAIPRSTFAGPQIKLSGYAIDLYTQGVRARMDDLKRYPEMALASHYELRLQIAQRFATREAAMKISPNDPELYLNSFNVAGFGEKIKGAPRLRRQWWSISADDIPENPTVHVSISPNLPAEDAQKMQKAKEALAMGAPFEWTARNIWEIDDVDELMAQRELEMLIAGDEMFKTFFLDYVKPRVFERNRDMGKAWEQWLIGQGLKDDPNMIDGETVQPQLQAPQDMQFIPEEELLAQQMAQQPQGASMPQGMPMPQGQPQGAPMPQGMPMPSMDNAPMGQLPPNAAIAQVLQGMQA